MPYSCDILAWKVACLPVKPWKMTLVSLDNSKFLMVLSYGVASLEKKRRPIVRNIVLWGGVCLYMWVGGIVCQKDYQQLCMYKTTTAMRVPIRQCARPSSCNPLVVCSNQILALPFIYIGKTKPGK